MIILFAVLILAPFSAFDSTGATGDDDSVTVFISVMNDGAYVEGNDGEKTTMAHVEIEVSYFDLTEYDLAKYTKDDEIGKGKPTVLHAYVIALEKYYMDGKKFTNGDESRAMTAEGLKGSMYMTTFWNHSCNLMYFIDYKYPLQSDPESHDDPSLSTIGATADDYILTDGMVIEIGMFTDTSFYGHGYFTSLVPDVASVTIGKSIDLALRGASTNSMGGETTYIPIGGQHLTFSKTASGINNRTEFSPNVVTAVDGTATVKFDEVGTYYVSAIIDFIDPDTGNRVCNEGINASATSPLAEIIVTGSSGDVTVTFDGNTSGSTVSPTSKTVTVGSVYGTLATATADELTFKEWNTSADGSGETITSDSVVTVGSDHTLYAIWSQSAPSGDTDNTVTYIIIGVVAAAIIIGALYFIWKRGII